MQTETNLADMAGDLPASMSLMAVAEAGAECTYYNDDNELRYWDRKIDSDWLT